MAEGDTPTGTAVIQSTTGLIPALTANTDQGFTVYASSEYPGFPAYNAVSHPESSVTGATWIAIGETATYRIQCPSPVRIWKVEFTSHLSEYANQGPGNGTIDGSTNGTSWTTLATFTNPMQTLQNPTDLMSFELNNTTHTAYLFYRIRITSINPAGSGGNIGLGYIQLYSYTLSTDGTNSGGGQSGSGTSEATGATPHVIQYPELVNVNLINQAINFADIDVIGHRIQIPVPRSILEESFEWTRLSTDTVPKGKVKEVADFVYVLMNAFSKIYRDLDADSDGLSFDSSALTSINDIRIRSGGSTSANDIVMAYVLSRLYGKTSIQTKDYIFNVEDAHAMLTNETLALAIGLSLYTDTGKNAVQEMFKQLVAKDGNRFKDASGNIPIALTSSADGISGSGTWKLAVNDCIEIRTEFVFHAPITRRDLHENTIVIPSGTTFRARLQLLATPDIIWTTPNPEYVTITQTTLSRIATTGTPENVRITSDEAFTTVEMVFRPQSSSLDAYIGLADSSGNLVGGFIFTPTGTLEGISHTYSPLNQYSIRLEDSTLTLAINGTALQSSTISISAHLCASFRKQGDTLQEIFVYGI
jgi:hypothetical protein